MVEENTFVELCSLKVKQKVHTGSVTNACAAIEQCYFCEFFDTNLIIAQFSVMSSACQYARSRLYPRGQQS